MITLDFTLAVSLYVTVFAFGLLITWVFFDGNQKLRRFSSEQDAIWQCSICTFFYIDSKSNSISACPRCGSLNKKSSK